MDVKQLVANMAYKKWVKEFNFHDLILASMKELNLDIENLDNFEIDEINEVIFDNLPSFISRVRG